MANTPITANAVNEAAESASKLLQLAIKAIDEAFGAGYAMKNPALVGQFMLAAATAKPSTPSDQQ